MGELLFALLFFERIFVMDGVLFIISFGCGLMGLAIYLDFKEYVILFRMVLIVFIITVISGVYIIFMPDKLILTETIIANKFKNFTFSEPVVIHIQHYKKSKYVISKKIKYLIEIPK